MFVIYTHVNGWDGRMDLYTNTKSTKPTPIIINIHDGGWNHGCKHGKFSAEENALLSKRMWLFLKGLGL